MKTISAPIDIKPRGLLNKNTSQRFFKLDLYPPPEALQTIVSNVWHVHWALADGQSYLQSNLPHPVQHIVLDPVRGSGFFGCSTTRFDYDISGSGQVIGFKLLPGMGGAFFNGNMSEITNQRLGMNVLIGDHAKKLEKDMQMGRPFADIITQLGLELSKIPVKVEQAMFDARHAVEFIETTQKTFRVHDLSQDLGLSKRQLQRLFYNYCVFRRS